MLLGRRCAVERRFKASSSTANGATFLVLLSFLRSITVWPQHCIEHQHESYEMRVCRGAVIPSGLVAWSDPTRKSRDPVKTVILGGKLEPFGRTLCFLSFFFLSF